MLYTIDKRTRIVWFNAETKSIKFPRKKFREHFNVKGAPAKSTIWNLVEKFLKTGSVHEAVRGGRKKTGRSKNNIDSIRRAVVRSQTRSVRRRALIV